MTHLEKFVALYREFGIECKVHLDKDGTSKISLVEGGREDPPGSTLSDKIGGYSGFFTTIVFDPEGNFVKQEIWE